MNIKDKVLYYAAAAATAIAGILHHHFASIIVGFDMLSGTFFIVTGIAQLFWALPMAARWGKKWYYIGIAGTAMLIILWVFTRLPNPITAGRALPINETGIAIEVLQIAYIIITAIIIVKENKLSMKRVRR